MRLLRATSWALLAGLFAFAAATYAGLPARIPAHLGFGGDPTRFAAKSPVFWFTLPGIGLVVFALLELISTVLPRRPQLFNFPDKDRLLALPAEFQAPVIEEMRGVLEATNVGVLLTLWAIHVLLWRVAMGEAPGALAAAPLLGFFIAPVVLVLVSRVTAATEREERRWKGTAGR